jgi:hypothetical protein
MRRGTIRVMEDGLYEASLRGNNNFPLRISGGWKSRGEAEVWLSKYGVSMHRAATDGTGHHATNRTEVTRA